MNAVLKTYATLEAFGVSFHRITFDEIVSEIHHAVSTRTRLLIGYTNLHGAYVAKRDDDLSTYSRLADIHYADGMPLIAWRRFLWGDAERKHRSTLSQTFPQLLESFSSKQIKIYYLGSEPDVLQTGIENLKESDPTLQIDGHHGYFEKERESSENKVMIDRINQSGADVLMVGFGMPRQERWILQNRDALNVPVIYATGAAIEYFSGHVARPPAWVSNNGLEWLFRLFSEPRKLWFRYIVEPWSLIDKVINDVTHRLVSTTRKSNGR